MKALIAVAVVLAPALIAFSTAAQAKLAPFEPRTISLAADDAAIDSGPSGAALESDYFHAPRPPYAVGRVFPCPLQLRVFEKTRLARSCD